MKNKNTVEIIKRFITASLVTFAVYLLTATVLYAFLENVGEYVIFVVSLIYSAVFSYFCIYYILNSYLCLLYIAICYIRLLIRTI